MLRREDKVIIVIDTMCKGEVLLIFDCFYHSRSVNANRNIIHEMKINECSRIEVIDGYIGNDFIFIHFHYVGYHLECGINSVNNQCMASSKARNE